MSIGLIQSIYSVQLQRIIKKNVLFMYAINICEA